MVYWAIRGTWAEPLNPRVNPKLSARGLSQRNIHPREGIIPLGVDIPPQVVHLCLMVLGVVYGT